MWEKAGWGPQDNPGPRTQGSPGSVRGRAALAMTPWPCAQGRASGKGQGSSSSMENKRSLRAGLGHRGSHGLIPRHRKLLSGHPGSPSLCPELSLRLGARTSAPLVPALPGGGGHCCPLVAPDLYHVLPSLQHFPPGTCYL